MKINDVKHNHSLTDLLKVLIFSILMITPLLSVATRCLYVICNKNAYQSYYGETINEKTDTYYDQEELIEGQTYVLHIGVQTANTSSTVYQGVMTVSNVIDLTNSFDLSTVNKINIFTRANNYSSAYFYDGNNVIKEYTFLNENNVNVQFQFLSNQSINTYFEDTLMYYQTTYNDYSFMDNVFEYSVNKLAESPILSWTQQTAIYTGVNTMTTQLGVNMPTIPMLITYWFLLTIIYVILDIVLKLFTILTHMIGGKKSS